jgi:cytochrome c oxidase cbb3-type subunit 3
MRFQKTLAAAALAVWAVGGMTAQQPPPGTPPGGGRGGRGGGGGGFVPGQQRRPEDPAQVAHGKAVYSISCTGCHGADLRGGDMGGPNLLRSQVAIVDKEGEMIIPIIHGSRQSGGMPAIPMSEDDAKAVAAYIRSVMAMIGRQGTPPGVGKEAPSILVGDAKAGQAAFDTKCAKCHSATGDLQGIATRISDPKMLQNTWVSGGGGGRRGRGAAAPPGAADARAVTATVKLPSGETVEGRVVRIDDFLVSIRQPDDTIRTFTRTGDVPKVEVHDPMKAHRDLLGTYTDKEMHDITAYLVTLK